MGLFHRTDDHRWSQEHLSHYVEGDLSRHARRRLNRHAADCADCSRGIRALRALLGAISHIGDYQAIRAPAGIFDLVRSGGRGAGGAAAQGSPDA